MCRTDNMYCESDLLFMIPADMHKKDDICRLLAEHPEIKFVSLVGVDLRGNDTDEKIPISVFLDDVEGFLTNGVQTDGSSVVLPGIATLNNGRLDIIADVSVNWFVDYNFEHIDRQTGRPIGTLRIPSFLIHNGRRVDSRAILRKAIDHFKRTIMQLLAENPNFARSLGICADDVSEILLIAATELEFWVKTPGDKAIIEELSVSQVLQEQYWKRTKGVVRTALEDVLILMEKHGLEPEMGHKEVGGVKARINGEGKFDHIMEQLEVDWKYSNALQAADNEMFVRILIKETFRRHGLEVTFMAKPIEGVAGSGEHTHVSVMAKLKDGRTVNLFTPMDMTKDFLSPTGWGALMGLLKNYEIINPFITSSNDAFNRLKPGFEAPVCIVASLGRDVATPSRFEVRSPNPHTNTYLALAAIYQGMLDGIKYAVNSGKSAQELEKEFSKAPGEEADYLEKERAYRSEEDVFEHYTDEERNRMFGTPPSTVWENLVNLERYKEKAKVLTEGRVFEEDIIKSYIKATRLQWTLELCERIISENIDFVRSCVKLHSSEDFTDYDQQLWTKINDIRHYLAKDSISSKSLFTRIRQAVEREDFDTASRLQLEMAEKIHELQKLYTAYKRNIIDFENHSPNF